MSYSEPARTTRHQTRIRWGRVAGLLVVIAAIAAVLSDQLLASSSSASSSSASPPAASSNSGSSFSASPPSRPRPPVVLRGEHPEVLGEADGAVPDGTTVFDDAIPGVARLDPALRSALRRAATDARSDGITFFVDSGWRSPQYQERLLDEAVSKYGSEAAASRWVATPNRSAHVSGHAVDIGPAAAATWLSAHGATYGLCQIYGNEPWHYELRTEAIDRGCPAMYADPTHDPRMQQ